MMKLALSSEMEFEKELERELKSELREKVLFTSDREREREINKDPASSCLSEKCSFLVLC